MAVCDVAIIGAGPYGLSVAAHLRAIDSLRIRIFGEPMSFWDRQMPVGMLLRSPWVASYLSDPKSALTLDAYRARNGNHFGSPVPLNHFIEYGRWFQRQAVPDVDSRQVALVESDSGEFRLTLEDGEAIKARRVVVAAGIAQFAWKPETFRNLPSTLASHSSEQREPARFAGKLVAVVGAGQSALESAALLHEAGAKVEVLARGPVVRWLHQKPLLHKWPIEPLLYAPTDVGPALASQLIARPSLYRRMPRKWQDRLGPRSIRPAGAKWLKPRLNDVPILTGHSVVAAVPTGDRLRLKFADGGEKVVDYVLLATGYQVNIWKYPFLDRKSLASIRQVDGYPQLDAGFESSIAGLHFLGGPAAWSFGPLMRFVAGAEFASRALVRSVMRER